MFKRIKEALRGKDAKLVEASVIMNIKKINEMIQLVNMTRAQLDEIGKVNVAKFVNENVAGDVFSSFRKL